MDRKKLLIVSVLAIFVLAMSLSAVSASSCTKVKTFKIDKEYKFKKLKKGDEIGYVYKKVEDGTDYSKGVSAQLTNDGLDDPKYNKLVKATVFFKKGKKVKKVTSKKVGGKTTILIKLKKGYTPYKINIYYKNK